MWCIPSKDVRGAGALKPSLLLLERITRPPTMPLILASCLSSAIAGLQDWTANNTHIVSLVQKTAWHNLLAINSMQSAFVNM